MRSKLLRAIAARTRHYAALLRARRVTHRRLAGEPVRRMLVVCYGNICRSAYLGTLMQKELGSLVDVRSGGFHGISGRETPERQRRFALRAGVDLGAHRSLAITPRDVEWADTIVLMDRYNWDQLRQMKATPEKLVWIGALTDESVEIQDPYELDDDAAREVYLRLRRAADVLISAIRCRTVKTEAVVNDP